MHFLTVTLLWHTANFTSPSHRIQMPLFPSNFFYKEIGIYIISVFYPFYKRLEVGDEFSFS